MKKLHLSTIGIVTVSLFLSATPVFAVEPMDSGSCTTVGQKAPATATNGGFMLVCNGSFWESCGFSPAPAGCPVPAPTPPPASCPANQTRVNGVCTPYLNAGGGSGAGSATSLTTNLWHGDYNPVDQVKLLQTFLNTEVNAGLPITGFFGDMTVAAVIRLQNKYASLTYLKANYTSPSGFVGQYTRDLINAKLGAVVTPPAAVTSYCTGADQIVPLEASTGANWPQQGQNQVRPRTGSGAYGANNAVVLGGLKNQTVAFKIIVPPMASFNPPLNINHVGFIHTVEVPGEAVTSRDFTVSKNPCDFQSGTYLYNAIGYGDSAPGSNFTVNNPTGFTTVGAQFNIQSGDTIYANVRTANNGVPSCPNTTCNILLDFASPNRY